VVKTMPLSVSVEAGDPDVGGHRQGEPGVVVKPGQDLGVRPITAVGTSESVVGEVGLPALVGHRGGEPDVGGFRLLLRFRDNQPSPGQVPGDGGPGHGDAVLVGQVPADGVRTGVQAGRRQLSRNSTMRTTTSAAVALGLDLGRRERGLKAALPSRR